MHIKIIIKHLIIGLIFYSCTFFVEAKIESRNIVLDNGMKVLIVKNPRIPLVNIVLGVNIGSKDETDKTNGWVHLFEHLILFSGTKDRKNEDILSEIRMKGGYINAHTNREYMTFELSLPSEHTLYGLNIVKEKVFNVEIEATVLDREKRSIEYELKQILNDPSQVGTSIVFNNLFKGHPYQRPSYGDIEIINKATIEELMGFYAKYFSYDNCSLVIIGDIDIAETEKKIISLYNTESEKKIIKEQIIFQKRLKKNIIVEQSMDIEQPYFLFGFFAPNYNGVEYAALSMLTQIIGGGANALLKTYLYRNKIYPTMFSMKYISLKYGGVVLIGFSVDRKMVIKTKNKILGFLKNIRNVKFTLRDYLPANRKYGADLLLRGKNHFRFISEEFKEKGLDTAVLWARFLLLDDGRRQRVKRRHEVKTKDLRRVAKKFFTKKYIFVELKPLEKKND